MVIVHYCLKNALLHSGVSVEKTPIRYSQPLSTAFQQKYFPPYWSLWPFLISSLAYTTLPSVINSVFYIVCFFEKKFQQKSHGTKRKPEKDPCSNFKSETAKHCTSVNRNKMPYLQKQVASWILVCTTHLPKPPKGKTLSLPNSFETCIASAWESVWC